MRAEIRRYVRTHLQDPELGPASIARAYAMSVRALHALFEDGDASVAGLVRSERLPRCLEDLQLPNGGSVTDIAFRWGFCDAAHFSRVFKREFGATPSEVRHAAMRRPRRLAPRRSRTLTALPSLRGTAAGLEDRHRDPQAVCSRSIAPSAGRSGPRVGAVARPRTRP